MDMEVLSVVAKQVMTIQAALAAGDRFFVFEGKNILLNRSLALFITMNPMYQFRNVLPSNLKALFRPVAMMVPDYRLIAEVSLYANGFQTAASLAVHVVTVLKIASHRMSAEIHYDFGMRTLKSVLVIAAQIRKSIQGTLPPDRESSLVRIALLRCNLSKLRSQDVAVFMSVLDREFPGPGAADQYLEEFKAQLIRTAGELKLHASPELINRAMQTDAMLRIRTGVVLLGPAACGKSTVIKVLQSTLSSLPDDSGGGNVRAWHVFPKAINPLRLWGGHPPNNTGDWIDGVITAAIRASSITPATDASNTGLPSPLSPNPPSPSGPAARRRSVFGALDFNFDEEEGSENDEGFRSQRGWIVLDGPVDPLWVEMLNPVLDDNRTLCLVTGETLPLKPGVNVIMEVDSISHASPATITRCGIVFMDRATEVWEPIIKTWVKEKLYGPLVNYSNKIEVTLLSVFGELIRAYADSLEPDAYTPRQQPTSVLMSMLRLLDSLLPEVRPPFPLSPPPS